MGSKNCGIKVVFEEGCNITIVENKNNPITTAAINFTTGVASGVAVKSITDKSDTILEIVKDIISETDITDFL